MHQRHKTKLNPNNLIQGSAGSGARNSPESVMCSGGQVQAILIHATTAAQGQTLGHEGAEKCSQDSARDASIARVLLQQLFCSRLCALRRV